ncbi:MAG TPA: maleylpyruvate isomerase family mycothiol-dependent enzyme [Acidimicrobiales bacterium]|nr:maleylpyruvate isomerase family mycothiol-dependent enzyme [Acidimicrobiales bacterium]
MTDVAAEYRRRADRFEGLVAGTPPDRWSSPSPCAGWTARDVVIHVVDFSAQVLHERAGIDDAPRFAEFETPLDAFRATRAAVEHVLDDAGTPDGVATYIQWSLGFDLPQHGWDLAMATGQDATIAPEELEIIWGSGDPEAFESAFGWQRAQGWYGAPIPVPEDAPLQDRVLGVLGRDPHWSAP